MMFDFFPWVVDNIVHNGNATEPCIVPNMWNFMV